MLNITNKKGFFIEISILSKSDKKVLKFKRLFYAKGTEVVLGKKLVDKPSDAALISNRLQVPFMEVVLIHPGFFWGVSWCLSQQTPTSCTWGPTTAMQGSPS